MAFVMALAEKLFELRELGGKGNEGIMTDHAAYNETSLMMGLYPELTDISKISSDPAMIGIWGDDPRSTSEQAGIRIIEKNVTVIGSRLREELSKLKWEPKVVKYTNMKKMYNA